MPIQSCTLPEGGSGYKWGASGKCYASRADAERQAAAAHANGFVGDGVALDAASARWYDEDGRLHVEASNISKANVCPYLGSEIPGYEELGLDPARVYQLFRDDDELRAAAKTFNNLPLLRRHPPVGVTVQDYRPDLVVGSTGTDGEFVAPYLRNSLVVWAADAIKGIESKQHQELSSAYRYDIDMTPGTYHGDHYDGRMINIRGNHVALVPVGRAGPDVVVGDSAMESASMKKAPTVKADVVKGAVTALRARLAQDADIVELNKLLDKLDADATPDISEDATETALLPGEKPPAKDDGEEDEGNDIAALKAMIVKLSEAVAALQRPAQDEPPAKNAPGEQATAYEKEQKLVSKPALDAAINAAVARERAAMRAVQAAEAEVAPLVGKLAVACDSAEQVYGTALRTLGYDVTGVNEAGLRALVRSHNRPAPAPLAQDAVSGGAVEFAKMFPDVSRIRLA